VREAARPRAEVIGEVASEEPRGAEARVLLDVGELVREERPACRRSAPDLAPARPREEDVASDDEGFGAQDPRRKVREGTGVEASRRGQRDCRSVADDLRSVE
jgi:hypothetical protein